ncbi:MAG: hypothetical protein RL407_1205 [Bacteroidota bacterium]|jgi:hypothetical protein
MRKLADLAHSRAGDKGNTLILSLFPLEEKNFSLLVEKVTAERVKEHLGQQIRGKVHRHVLPELHALLFTCEGALAGGVTTSLALDAHGKSLSYALLELTL